MTTSSAIPSLLSQFGEVDESSVVLSLKPPKKAPTKPPKNGTALVPFKQIGDAFAAVCASGRADRRLEGIEISWAEGKEPPILGWLKRQGKLDPAQKPQSNAERENGSGVKDAKDHAKAKDLFEALSEKPTISSFASFPDSFVSTFYFPLLTRFTNSQHSSAIGTGFPTREARRTCCPWARLRVIDAHEAPSGRKSEVRAGNQGCRSCRCSMKPSMYLNFYLFICCSSML